MTTRGRIASAPAGAMLALLFACLPLPGVAQVVAIALDPKAVLEDGELKVRPDAPPGALAVLRFDGARAERLGTVALPTGFQGPPTSVAITPDGRYALATASMRIDPADPAKLAPESLLSVVDLAASPLRVMQTLRLDASPASIALHPDGRMALVPHPADDSISVLSWGARRPAPGPPGGRGKETLPPAAAPRTTAAGPVAAAPRCAAAAPPARAARAARTPRPAPRRRRRSA